MINRIEQMMRDGRLPDPRTLQGIVVYMAIGLALGLWYG
jgi:hypothetical protein